MKYLVYGIVPEVPRRPGRLPKGIGGRPVSRIAAQGLAASCSRVNGRLATPNVAQVAAFARVVAALHARGPVLPMRYGCVFETKAQAVEFLEKRRARFLAALGELEGCCEMGIRVLLRGREAKGSPPAPAPVAGAAYLAGRASFYAARDGAHEDARGASRAIRRALRGRFVGCRVERSSVGAGRLLSLFFLIRQSDEEAFRRAFHTLQQREDRKLLLTGPWPPYNFVPCEKAE